MEIKSRDAKKNATIQSRQQKKKVISLLINLTLCISIELHTRQLKEKPTILINGIFKANKPTKKNDAKKSI